MTSLAPPSTGKKKRARRVFGEAVADGNDNDQENSLSYSPSPLKTSFDESVDSESKREPSILAPLLECDVSSDGSEPSVATSSCSSSGPFDTIISLEKENDELSTAKDDDVSTTSSDDARAMDARVRDIRMTTRSPLRRDLVKQTQDAINKASVSVNHSLVAAQQAKQAALRQKVRQTQKSKSQWKHNTNEVKSFNYHMQQSRQELLSLQRQLSSKYSRERARRGLAQKQDALQRIDEESKFKSRVFRLHQKQQKVDEDERRRRSIVARAKLRSDHRAGEQKMRLARLHEDEALSEERHEAGIALRVTTRENADRRRKSFQFRRGDARRIRTVQAVMEDDRRQKEHASYELKWGGEKDVEAHVRQLARARRESLAKRNEWGRVQRAFVSDQQSKERQLKHESYVLEREAAKDVDAYKEHMAEERRHSLAQRNKYAWKQRQDMEQQRHDEMAKQHESYELKVAGEKDAELYLIQIEEKRRESLVLRNREGKRQRDLVRQQHSDQLHEEHLSYQMKWAGEKDAEAYIRQLEQERRNSLAGRNRDAHRRCMESEQQNAETLVKEHSSYELKRAADRDVDTHKRNMERERRESTAKRNKERFRHAQVMEELRLLTLEKETESYVLKWAGENDAKEYLAKLESERRQSLQLRGKQVLHHRDVEDDMHQAELLQLHETEKLRAEDSRNVEAYRYECEERDRKSLEFRRKAARAQRIGEQQRLVEQHEEDESNFQLETMARTDVEEYVQECKQRRRMSLALRAKEKRRHAKIDRYEAEFEREERSRQVHDRLMDQRYVELAQQKEKAQQALDALRHRTTNLGCGGSSFNPFAGVLA